MKRPIVSTLTLLTIVERVQEMKIMIDNEDNNELLEGYAHHCINEFTEVICIDKRIQPAWDSEVNDHLGALVACEGKPDDIRALILNAILGLEEIFEMIM